MKQHLMKPWIEHQEDIIKIVESMPDRKPEEPENENLEKEEIPSVKSETTILTPELGEMTFIQDEALYKEIIKYLNKTFPSHRSVFFEKLTFADNVMKGSNSYIVTAIGMFLKENNLPYRIAELKTLESKLNSFKGNYVDTGLALRRLNEPNKEKAEYLFNQLKARGITTEQLPVYIAWRGLKLDSGLNFNLTDESIYKTENSLKWKSGASFSKTDELGFPSEKDKNSSRQIWTRSDNSGLSRVYLNGGGDLGASSDNLAYSYGNGRVVFVSNAFGVANDAKNQGGKAK